MQISPLRLVSRAFAEAWRLKKSFLLSHLLFVILTVTVLTPLTSLTLRASIALSGEPALSDFDIALFLLSPVGFLAALLVFSLLVTTAVLDVAFMMAIAVQARRTGKQQFEEGFATILPRLPFVMRFAWRLLLRVGVLVVPFLLFGLLVAGVMLTDYDINYYLSTWPPEIMIALAVIGLAAAVAVYFLSRALLGWAVALPLVLFADVCPQDIFTESKRLMTGKRSRLLMALLLWLLLSVILLSCLLGALHLATGSLISHSGSNLGSAAVVLFVAGLFGFLLNAIATAITSGALACLLMEEAGWPATSGAVPASIRDRSSLRRLLIVALAAGAVAFVVSSLDLSSYKVADDVQVIAHRGAAGARPENTLAAFEKAIEDGADWLELDVQESADGEVIVVHDSDFMKLAGDDLKVWDATSEKLAEIDIGSWFSSEFADQRTPTLREVLLLAEGTPTGVLIELKYYGHDEKLEERVAALVEETGLVEQVRLMSLKYEAVKKMKALRPEWTVGLLAAASVGRLWDLEADFLAVNMGMANGALVGQSTRVGKPLFVWTVNDPLDMSRMMSLGVNGLITDEPALAREIIAQRAELNSVERLVLTLGSQMGYAISEREYRDASP